MFESTCSTAAALLFTFAPCYAFKNLRSSVKRPFALAWCAAVSPALLTLDRLQACYAIVITCATLTATYSSAKMLVQARISCLPQRATGLRVSHTICQPSLGAYYWSICCVLITASCLHPFLLFKLIRSVPSRVLALISISTPAIFLTRAG